MTIILSAPGFVFLVTLVVEILLNKIKGIEIKKFNLKYIIPIFIMILMLFATVNYLSDYDDEGLVINERDAANWMGDKDGVIYSDRGPIYTWYLQKEVEYPSNYRDSYLLNQELVNGSADYYIGMDKVNLTDFNQIKEFGHVTVYQKNF